MRGRHGTGRRHRTPLFPAPAPPDTVPVRVLAVLVAVGLVVAGPLLAAGPAQAAPAPARAAIGGSPPALPTGATLGQALPSTRVVSVAVELALPDPAALSNFVAAVSTPGAPEYRRYLAQGQFAGRFGPSRASIAAVRAWLLGAGLTPGPTTADGLLVPAEGSAGRVAGAFGTSLEQVRLPSGGSAYADTATPSVPGDLAGVVAGVVGLDDLGHWYSDLKVASHPATGPTPPEAPGEEGSDTTGRARAPLAADALAAGPQACATASALTGTGTGALAFNELAAAYGMSGLYSQGRVGSGVTIALYELEPHLSSDVSSFERCYGLDTPVRTVTVDGGPGPAGPGSGEAALDIEDAAAMAPDASILVYQGPDGTDVGPIETYDRIASDDLAEVVSTSWGQCEPEDIPAQGGTAPAEADIFEEMAAQGQTMVAASGDSGSEGCWHYPTTQRTTLAVEDPASQPDVTGVGGTSLPSATVARETVWNDCLGRGARCARTAFAGASGGGISQVWQMPQWQLAAAGRGTVNRYTAIGSCDQPPSTYCREVPDVAADADPATGYVTYWDGSWGVVGGTSGAAPLWAALFALVDQGCASSVGMANPALYDLGDAGSAAFHDITPPGDDDLTGSHTGDYPVTTGYDLATGWGSPDAAVLLPALQPAGGCPVVTGVSPGSGPIGGGSVVTITGSDLAGATAVMFGPSLRAHILSDSATTITATVPAARYSEAVSVTVTTAAGTSARSPTARYVFGTPHTGLGYWLDASDGGVFAFGDAAFHGSAASLRLAAPVVGMAPTPTDGGYWEAASDGGVFSFGDAAFYGSMAGVPLNHPVVGMAPTPTGGGYWLVASDGGVFSFGDAAFYGSMAGVPLNHPVVGIAPTPAGGGYWLVASDGGVFAFGDAAFYGSTASLRLADPVVGIASTPTGGGYWLVASDGGVFSFGDAAFYGSTASLRLAAPVVGIASTPTGGGYWLVASDGGVFSFGDAAFYGSAAPLPLAAPVVSMMGA